MEYTSTRGGVSGISFEQAVLMGLAPDGGLIIPEKIPELNEKDLKHLSELPYNKLAFEIIDMFQDDIPSPELKNIIDRSYSNFGNREIIPIKRALNMGVAELFHGPTYSFKDFALQFLGNIFEYFLSKSGRQLNIVGATSGDTGSAAIYGVKGKANINIFILYPKNRVSSIQEMQMTSVADENVYCLEVPGNFDNCQELVKNLFNDLDFKESYSLGAVNSINWARILAQIVYYFWIYFRGVYVIGDKLNIAVPTGNFGNIFAGFMARKMGLPINKLMIATNRNNILTRAVRFGDYSIERVNPTISPAMDIQVASNFERYLYYLYDERPDKVIEAMDNLKTTKEIDIRGTLLGKLQRDFIAGEVLDEEMKNIIREVYMTSGYLVDPHTACGLFAAREIGIDEENTICLSTAHPAKFPEVIMNVLSLSPENPEGLVGIEEKAKRSYEISLKLDELKRFIMDKIR